MRALRIKQSRFAVRLKVMFTEGFVNLYTRNIEAGIHFYRDLLGFRETFRTRKEGTARATLTASRACSGVKRCRCSGGM